MPDISRNGVEVVFTADPDGDTYNRKDAREFAEDILRLCEQADEIAAQCEQEGHTPLKDADQYGKAYCTRCHALYEVQGDARDLRARVICNRCRDMLSSMDANVAYAGVEPVGALRTLSDCMVRIAECAAAGHPEVLA